MNTEAALAATAADLAEAGAAYDAALDVLAAADSTAATAAEATRNAASIALNTAQVAFNAARDRHAEATAVATAEADMAFHRAQLADSALRQATANHDRAVRELAEAEMDAREAPTAGHHAACLVVVRTARLQLAAAEVALDDAIEDARAAREVADRAARSLSAAPALPVVAPEQRAAYAAAAAAYDAAAAAYARVADNGTPTVAGAAYDAYARAGNALNEARNNWAVAAFHATAPAEEASRD